ncbi:MAG: BamA/OMP85 family outer membrane protein [Gemmatimonadota bacterium]
MRARRDRQKDTWQMGSIGTRAASAAPEVRRAVRAPLCATVLAATVVGCGLGRGAEAFPELVRFQGREIDDVEFVETGPFDADTLEDLVETQPTRCRLLGLPICVPGTDIGREVHRLDLGDLRRDVAWLELFYRASGYYGTRVEPEVDVSPEEEDEVVVTFRVRPGDPVYLDALRVTDTEPVLDPDSIEPTLPLQPGELFDLGELAASRSMVLEALLERGHAYADVFRSYTVDTVRDRATARLTALPGPLVVVDTIVVVGADALGRAGTLRQLALGAGDVARRSVLAESQRNLYALELVRVASVTLVPEPAAPEEVVAEPAPRLPPDEEPGPPPGLTAEDTLPATVVVTIEEAPVHVVDALAGFGTVECLRVQAQWVSRSFRGGGRRLALSGSVSKIGIGSGLGGGLCDAFEGDPFRTELDYRVAAELVQPWLLTPRNRLTAAAFAERQSEPGVFQRESRGAQAGVVRRLAPGAFLSGVLELRRTRTRATPALFCLAFQVCLPDDIAEAQRPRWRNSLTARWARDRLLVPLDRDSGYVIRGSAMWATPLLGSDLDFVRSSAEGALREPLPRDRTFAGSLRLGSYFGTATLDPANDFLPPEERFYAGGPNSVRGYGRNQVGPGIWVVDVDLPDTITEIPDIDADQEQVRFVPTGGTSVGVASVELRFPAPFGGDRLRLATFVDAGAVADVSLWRLGPWRVTPGAGVRIRTPVGPIRVDLAYNPHGLSPGPLFAADPESGALVRLRDRFRPDFGLFDRLQLHLAFGEPF